MVRSLVALHGGTVQAFSAGLGQGTRVRVTLPLAAAPVSAASAAETASPVGARRILVADDNADAADLLAEVLRLSGHDVHTAFDGRAAIALAESVRPEVMILDIGMPLANGYEVAAWVRAQDWGRDVLLVAVTGWGRGQDGDRATEAGFDRHLVKPVDMEQLMALLAGA